MKILIIGIAQVVHAINAAYCKAMGDDTQVEWEDAPEWQQQSAIAGVEMHLANPDATPEQSHESWLKQKLDEGWVYGETKDAEAKQHPCCIPYAELPVEQKAKDYIFRAAVHAAKALADSMPKPIEVTAPTGFSGKVINVQYIGVRDEWSDHIYGTGLHFTKGQVRAIPPQFANKLLRHADIFTKTDDAVIDDEETLAIIDDAQSTVVEKEAKTDQQYDILHQVSQMSRDALVRFAAERYQVKLNGRGKADDLRIEVTKLVNQYGAL
ncbi:MAG: RyR domain-containing protein [Desulfuromonas sp.]|nr:RyR domain-containing protein [Desulfuromonas sp.]